MNKKIFVFIFLFLLLPLQLFNVNSDNKSKNNADETFSSYPPVSSDGGGLGKVWEQEWEHAEVNFLYSKEITLQGVNIYALATVKEKAYGDYFVFLVKFSQNGSVVWEKKIQEENKDISGISIWSDRSEGGNIYLLYSKYFYNREERYHYEYILAEIDSDNSSMVWEKRIDFSAFSILGNKENLYVCGKFLGVTKLSLNGSIVWEKEGVFVNNMFLTDEYLYLTSSGANVSVVKMDLDGSIIWENEWGNEYVNDARSIYVNENIYVTGNNLDTYSRSSIFVFKMDLNGSVIWEDEWDQSLYDYSYSITGDNDSIYIGGRTGHPKDQSLIIGWTSSGDVFWEDKGSLNEEISYVKKDQQDFYSFGRVAPFAITYSTMILTKWIEDTTIPFIISLENLQLEQSDSTFTLTWYVEDENPDSYTILLNGSIIESGDWSSGSVNIELDLSSSLGQYNYTIVLADLSGNIARDSCVVAIKDTIAPKVHGDYSNESNEIVWIAEDRNPASYTIYEDGEVIASGDWVSEGEISIIVIPEKRNSLNFTIVVEDVSGNSNSNSIIVSALSSRSVENPTISGFNPTLIMLFTSFSAFYLCLFKRKINKNTNC